MSAPVASLAPQSQDAQRRAVDEMARILKLEGTQYLFSYPINPLIDAATAQGIRPIIARTERAVVGMADGYARALRGEGIGVCAVQYGPGTENSFGALAQAYSDSSPVLFLPGGVAESRTDVRPNFEAVRNLQHITKWVARINRPDRVGEMMRRAFTQLRNGRRGPVALELPGDVATQAIGPAASAYSSPRQVRTCSDADAIRHACAALVDAKSPVLHAGAGVLASRATEELVALAELLCAPVMTTLSGKSGFPENHPLSLGSGGMAWPEPVTRSLQSCDLIFGIGASLTKSIFAAPLPPGRLGIQLTVDESDLNKDYPVTHLLVGDAKEVLRQLLQGLQTHFGAELRTRDRRPMEARIAHDKQTWLAAWQDKLNSEEVPINPYRVVRDLSRALRGREVIITHDAGSPRDQLSPFYVSTRPGEYMGWGRSTHLGYSLPLALGAKLASPNSTVVHLLGDAAFGECAMDLETAVRNRIGVVTVLMNNGCMGGYDKHIPLATSAHGARFLTGDYTRIAQGLGAWTRQVRQPHEILTALEEGAHIADTGVPACIEVLTAEELALSQS